MTSPVDYVAVVRRAEQVLRDNSIVRPPILPRELAQSYGLEVKVVGFDREHASVAGFIDFDERVIYANAEDHFNRQTFTVAHELGHYLLHRTLFEEHPEDYKVLLRMPLGAETDPVEKEANAFAANLLVPRKFLDFYGRYAEVDELADLFAVSKEVIRFRLKFASPTARV